jgi:transposase
MAVYPPGASGASPACPGCVCRDRVPRYPSDLTDAQWELLRPEAEQVMAELRRASGRPMVHDLRAMLDAIGYVVRNGIEWRALPVDFPPWEAVYAFFQRWAARGLPQRLTDRLRGRLRVGLGRHVQPSAAIIDSQSVKAADTVGAASRGFDSAKKINGRKRHLAVDVEGLLLAVVVTAASVGDRMGAKLLVIALGNTCTRLRLIWADAGYDGRPLRDWIRTSPTSPWRSSNGPSWGCSASCGAGGWWSAASAGCCATGAWSATTNAGQPITRRWCTGQPS